MQTESSKNEQIAVNDHEDYIPFDGFVNVNDIEGKDGNCEMLHLMEQTRAGMRSLTCNSVSTRETVNRVLNNWWYNC